MQPLTVTYVTVKDKLIIVSGTTEKSEVMKLDLKCHERRNATKGQGQPKRIVF
jgi:hypothetical protein